MISRTISTLLLLMFFGMSFSACGGGGGGSGSDEDSSSPSIDSSNDSGSDDSSVKQGIRIIHAAIDGGPVEVLLKTQDRGLIPFGVTRFNQTNTFFLPEGASTIALSARGSGGNRQPVSEFQITTIKGKKSSLLIAGLPSETFATTLLVSPPTTTPKIPADNGAEQVSVRFVHGVSRAAEVIALVNGSPITNIKYGQVSSLIYLPLAPEVSITLVRAIDSRALGTITLSAKAGDVWTIFAGGEADYYTFVNKFAD